MAPPTLLGDAGPVQTLSGLCGIHSPEVLFSARALAPLPCFLKSCLLIGQRELSGFDDDLISKERVDLARFFE